MTDELLLFFFSCSISAFTFVGLFAIPCLLSTPRVPLAARLSNPSNLVPPLGERSNTLDPLKIFSDT